MGPSRERRRIIAGAEQFRACGVSKVMNGVATIAPRRVTERAGADEVVERCALAEGWGRRFAAGAIHARQPPPTCKQRFLWIRDIDDGQCVIDESIEMDRNVGVSCADPPNSMRAEPRHVEKRNFTRARRICDIEYAHPRRKWLLGLHRVDQGFCGVVLLTVILLHCSDIRAVDGEENVAMNL